MRGSQTRILQDKTKFERVTGNIQLRLAMKLLQTDFMARP